jgi:hypothetical protein
LWACQDLNLGPHPYQGSAHRLVSPGSHLRPGRMMCRWRPLRTAGFRWHVDQTWTRHARSRGGSGAPPGGPCRGKGDPRRLPPTSEPRPGDRLVRGSPGGVWARDIPLCRRAVPDQRLSGTPAPCRFKPRSTARDMGSEAARQPRTRSRLAEQISARMLALDRQDHTRQR